MRELYFGSRESGLPGVQDKISSKMLNARARSAEREYIVKFNPTEVPYAVENEYFFLQMARRAGLATGNFELLTDKNGRHALRIERFDRAVDVQTMNKTKFAVEDGAQVLGLYPLEKYDVDFIEMSNKFSGLSGSSLIAAFDLFKQLVFNWLIGNGDAHAKNFSIIQKPAVGFQISPAYDLLCTLYYEDKTMALAVNGSKSGWDRKFLTDAALKLGLNAKVSEKIIDSMITGLASLPDLILDGALPFRRDQNIEVSGLLKKRLAKASN
jgi:serine/threonine-protein kinase HipA